MIKGKTEKTGITVYGTTWCPDVARARDYLDKNNIPYVWIDIEENADEARLVEGINDGNRSVPTIIFSDGSILVEPSNDQLAEKIS